MTHVTGYIKTEIAIAMLVVAAFVLLHFANIFLYFHMIIYSHIVICFHIVICSNIDIYFHIVIYFHFVLYFLKVYILTY